MSWTANLGGHFDSDGEKKIGDVRNRIKALVEKIRADYPDDPNAVTTAEGYLGKDGGRDNLLQEGEE